MRFLPEHIEERLRAEVAGRGLVLLEVKRRGEQGTTVVEVIVDSEQAIGLDELTSLARWTGELFDEAAEAIPGHYKLEISSGGLDRPLEHLWQYRKNVGRLIKLTYDDGETRKTELFQLVGVDDAGLSVALKNNRSKAPVEPVAIPFDRVVRAVIEPQF
ncbi:MAG: hypothetical protein JWQ98_1469 [Chlorobi bacterium]|nr:hypothetical protein [Chlorobiota bacterium]